MLKLSGMPQSKSILCMVQERLPSYMKHRRKTDTKDTQYSLRSPAAVISTLGSSFDTDFPCFQIFFLSYPSSQSLLPLHSIQQCSSFLRLAREVRNRQHTSRGGFSLGINPVLARKRCVQYENIRMSNTRT